MYTLRLPWKKIYVVSSPNTLATVDRNARTVSFAPFVVEFAKRMLLVSRHAIKSLEENNDGTNGARGCRWETLQAMHATLAPGEALETLTQDMLYAAPRSLPFAYAVAEPEYFDLVSTTRRIITQISTSAIYGPEHNPFQQSKVEAGFW